MQQPPNQFTPQYQPQPYYPPQQQPQYPQPYYPPMPQPYYPPPMPNYMLSNQVVNVSVLTQQTGVQQYGCLVRSLYFVFIGWWLGLTWAIIALLFCATFIGLPIGMVMLNSLPAVLTLQRH